MKVLGEAGTNKVVGAIKLLRPGVYNTSSELVYNQHYIIPFVMSGNAFVLPQGDNNAPSGYIVAICTFADTWDRSKFLVLAVVGQFYYCAPAFDKESLLAGSTVPEIFQALKKIPDNIEEITSIGL